MDKIKIIVADDHGVVRSGVRAMLETQPDMEVLCEASTGNEAHARILETRPDVAILDIELPGVTGIELTELLREEAPDTRVLILSMHEDQSFVRLALAAGARGYVAKKAVGSELIAAIRRVHRGIPYVAAQDSGHHGAPAPTPETARPKGPLSPREMEVLELLAYGNTNEEIGRHLDISAKTVGTYRSRLADKLGLESRVDIVRYALDNGLLVPGQARES